jgi:polyferredoxin
LVSGRKLPVLLALLVVGSALTLFFPEELWHRYLCPYGLILSFPSSKAKHAMTVNSVLCNNCGTCMRVCPAKAVVKKDKHEITTKDCLVCMECSRSCKQEAIQFI